METPNEGATGAQGPTSTDEPDFEAAAAKREAEDRAASKREADEKAAAERERLLADMKPLTGADILATRELVTEWVPVPKWGGKVLVRELTGTERDAFEASIVVQKGKQRTTNTENIRAKLAQLAIVDHTDPKKRAPLFTRKQVDQLGKLDAASLDLIYDVAARLSGLTPKDVEELEGNSAAADGGGSSPS